MKPKYVYQIRHPSLLALAPLLYFEYERAKKDFDSQVEQFAKEINLKPQLQEEVSPDNPITSYQAGIVIDLPSLPDVVRKVIFPTEPILRFSLEFQIRRILLMDGGEQE